MLDIREKNINKFFFIARFFVKRIFCIYERESLRTQKLLQIIWYLLTWPILSGKQKRRCYEPIFLDYCLGMFHDSEIKCKSMSFLELTRILGSCCISKYVKVKDKSTRHKWVLNLFSFSFSFFLRNKWVLNLYVFGRREVWSFSFMNLYGSVMRVLIK